MSELLKIYRNAYWEFFFLYCLSMGFFSLFYSLGISYWALIPWYMNLFLNTYFMIKWGRKYLKESGYKEPFRWGTENFGIEFAGICYGWIIFYYGLLTIHIFVRKEYNFGRCSRCWGFRGTNLGYDFLESIDFGLGPFLLITWLR